ncbi:hypothetical protein C8J56DRAFT_943335 [Mycena floridula]|nr:hypothetical protein C8J56DRAFT_943335 [Mycena floridula]
MNLDEPGSEDALERFRSLLSTNDPPLNEEREYVLQRLEEKTRKLEQLDEQVTQTRQELERLNELRKETEDERNACHMVLSPDRWLPPEILGEIFSHCVQDDLFEQSWSNRSASASSLDHRDAPWTLSRVSKKWRSVCLSISHLWSSISLVLQQTKPIDYSVLALQLERSQSAPLSISITGRGDLDLNHPVLQRLISSSSRWFSLCVYLVFNMEAMGLFFKPITGRLPLLQSLSFLPASDDNMSYFSFAPRLRTLVATMTSSQLQWPGFPWEQITDLRCPQSTRYIVVDEILRSLTRTTNLQQLYIDCYESFSMAASVSHVELNHLTRISLNCCTATAFQAFFSTISAPLLESLELRGDVCDRDRWYLLPKPFIDLTRRSRLTLKHLRLVEIFFTDEELLSWLEAAPSMVSLIVDAVTSSPTSPDFVFDALVPRPGLDLPVPLLRQLTLRSFAEDGDQKSLQTLRPKLSVTYENQTDSSDWISETKANDEPEPSSTPNP